MSTKTNRAIVERFDKLLGAPDLDELEQLCTKDMVNHALAPDRPQGLAGTREFLTRSAAMFGDTGWINLNVIAEGEFVVHHGVRGGNWKGGSLFGFDLQPGHYQREVVFMYRLRGGRITDRWAVRDDLTMLRQLGGLPPTQPPPDPLGIGTHPLSR
jgi:predicted ester cyclase